MSLLETVFSILYQSLIDNDGKLSIETIQTILSKMIKLNPSHFGISISNLNLPYMRTMGSIGYQHVFGDDSSPFTMAVFILPKSCHMPLHNHPDMTVMSTLLFGKIRLVSYDWVPSTKKYDRNGLLTGKGQLKEDEILSAPNSWVLYPDKKNLHSFVALEDTAIFDVITPPYSDDGRNCSFFTIDDQPKISSPYVCLQEFHPEYHTVSYPYLGPTLSYFKDKKKKSAPILAVASGTTPVYQKKK